MKSSVCEVHRFGLIDYQEAWDLQKQFAVEIAAGDRPATLLLLEHPHTYTFGRRGNAGNLLWDETELRRKQISVHWVDRGGDVTYHGPGQLVGYPLLPLGMLSQQAASQRADRDLIPRADYVGYLRKLEQTIISTVAEFGVKAKQVEGLTGVWVEMDQPAVSSKSISDSAQLSGLGPKLAKLAAIGVKVGAQGISMHGFALNVNPDMQYWEGIVGCGLPYPQISLAELLNPLPAMEVIMRSVVDVFGKIFDYEIK
jgi:lipoate-protein ligase B